MGRSPDGQRDLREDDIQFLANTLNPLPGGRFTTLEILESGYLDIRL
jgi:hypothetical protein